VNKRTIAMPVARRLYLISIFALTLTGFGQMPIFKRYYIADIPGLGWLAQYYVTHYAHYLFSVLFLAVISYFAVVFIGMKKNRPALKTSDIARIICVAGLAVTGILLAVKNLDGVYWHFGLITWLDLIHLGFVMGVLVVGLVAWRVNKKEKSLGHTLTAHIKPMFTGWEEVADPVGHKWEEKKLPQ